MKRILLILSILVLSVIVMAQAPQQFSYQALIRDAENEIVSNRVITLQVNIVTTNGNVVYSETHQTATNENGVVSVAIGSGTTTDDFSQIDWSKGEFFLQTTIDLGAGEQLVSGDSPLLSVPYAFYAEKAGNAVEVDLTDYAKKLDIPEAVDLSGYALKSEIPAEVDLTDYAKKSDIPEAVDLSGYYSKAEVEALLANLRTELIATNGNPQQGNVSIENGAIKAAFSISESKQIYFSQGNLQYQASTGTWRFAEHQYDIIGADNANISETYEGWIDLFGWGTSGWNSGANAYQPYSTSTTKSDYYPGGDYTNNLTGSYANADWGVYNAISNGGNQVGQWRTLTKDEWSYLISGRVQAGNLMGMGKINNLNGLILLPDGWKTPSSVIFDSFESVNYYYNNSINVYSQDEWAVMQSYGAVFLPAAGSRNGTVVNNGSRGNYWSSSYNNYDLAYDLYFYESYVSANDSQYTSDRWHGFSVRVVQDVE